MTEKARLLAGFTGANQPASGFVPEAIAPFLKSGGGTERPRDPDLKAHAGQTPGKFLHRKMKIRTGT
jgi:hypothetical protein